LINVGPDRTDRHPTSATNLDAGKHAGAHQVIDPGPAHPQRLRNLVGTQQQSLHDHLAFCPAGSRPPELECFGVSAGSSRGREPTEHRRARSQVTWSSMSRVGSSLAVNSSARVRRRSGRVTGVRFPTRSATRAPSRAASPAAGTPVTWAATAQPTATDRPRPSRSASGRPHRRRRATGPYFPGDQIGA
jgi:hypothetical protein